MLLDCVENWGFCYFAGILLCLVVDYRFLWVFFFFGGGDGDGLFRNQRVESFRCKLGLFCSEIDFCKS